MSSNNKFGTFAGVYTPSVLTILGVIMYMRLGWVVGEAGLWAALSIILLSHVISITTGLSISSVATDKKIKTGGIYYLLSRSLGFPMGGSIGITLFIGTAFSIALYIIGFSENFLGIEALSNFFGMGQDINSYRIFGSAVLILLVVLAFISTSLALKSQFFILGAIALSLVSIIVGIFQANPDAGTTMALAPADGHVPLITIFAIFFPAVTGFTAGVAMSGDLKDPKKAIPSGTLWSIATGLVVYVGLALLFALFVDRKLLLTDNNFLIKIAWFSPLVIAGIWGATLSSALGGILGAPRILQAIAMDKILPGFLGKGYGEGNEPRNALIFTFVLAELGILIGELDAIAEIVSMFYIAAYGFINLAFALESWASTDFRPTFKISKWIGIVGFIASFGVMFQLNPGAMFAAFIIMWLIYFLLKRKEIKSEAGDVWSSVWSSIVKTSLTKLQKNQIEERNWKPNIILFSGDKANRSHLITMGKAFAGRQGFLSVFDLLISKDAELLFTRKEQSPVLKDEDAGSSYFERRHSVANLYDGILQISATYGFSGIEPNTVMMGWARNTKEPERFGKLIRQLYRLDMNILMMDYDRERQFGNKKLIDIWWRGAGQNGNLALQLAKFVQQHEEWKGSRLRLLIINPINAEHDHIIKRGHEVFNTLRIDGEVKVINNEIEKRSFYDIIQIESVNSDLIFMGIPDLEDGEEKEYIEHINELCRNIGTVILVKASSFFKALNIGKTTEIKEAGSTYQVPVRSLKQEPVKPKYEALLPFNEQLSERFKALVDGREDLIDIEFTAHEHLLMNRVNKEFQKAFMNLEFAYQESKSSLTEARITLIHNKLLNNITHLIQEFTEEQGVIEKRQEQVQNTRQALISTLETLFKEMPCSLKINYPPSHFAPKPNDRFDEKVYKTGMRLLKKIYRGYRSKIYIRRIFLQAVLPQVHDFIYEEFRTLDKRLLRLYFDLLALFSKTDYAFIFMANELRTKQEISSLSLKKKELFEELRTIEKDYHLLREELSLYKDNIRLFLIKSLTELLEQGNPNYAIHEEINQRHFLKKLVQKYAQLPAQFATTLKLVINNLVLNNVLLLYKNQLKVETNRFSALIEKQLKEHIIKKQEALLEALNDRIARKDDSLFTLDKDLTSNDFQTTEAEELLKKANKRLVNKTGRLPSKLVLTDEDSFNNLSLDVESTISTINIAVKELLDFITLKEFAEPLEQIIKSSKDLVDEFNRQTVNHMRVINYSLSSDEEIAGEGNDKESTIFEQHKRYLLEEMKNSKESLVALQNRIKGQSGTLENKLSLHAFIQSATSLKQYVREYREMQHINKLTKASRQVIDFIKEQYAKLIYSKSAGLLFTHSLLEEEKVFSVKEKLVREYRESHIDRDVYDRIPFFYKHLFQRKQNFSMDFLAGREEEIHLAGEYLKNYNNGFKLALMITGPRHSGKSFLRRVIEEKLFVDADHYTLTAPPGGSTDKQVFKSSVAATFNNNDSFEENLKSISSSSVISLEDIELWWEKSPGGDQLLQHIFEVVARYMHKHYFIFIINEKSFAVIRQFLAIEKYFSGVIECKPLTSRTIGELIMKRQRISDMKLVYQGREESQFKSWHYAKIFNRLFKVSQGNPGLALHHWINNIVEVNKNKISIRLPVKQGTSSFDLLLSGQKVLLLQLIIHNGCTVEKLARVMKRDTEEITVELNELLSMGLVSKNDTGTYKTEALAHHRIVNYFEQKNIL